jgi:erythrin-vacuolar iron transport family protein
LGDIRKFSTLSEQEVLAVAISNEEEDGRTYADFAHGLRETYPDSARMFDDLAAEEGEHRRTLIDLYVTCFGSHIPQMRRQHISGAPSYQPAWQIIPRGIESIRERARQMEGDASRFYTQAASHVTDAGTRKLLGDLAKAELGHQDRAVRIEAERLPSDARTREDAGARKRFVLQIVQPGLFGLMDGSVSTLVS